MSDSGRLRALVGLAVAALAYSACLPGPFDPPQWPMHDKEEGGYEHARGLEYPYLCPDSEGLEGTTYGVECFVRTRAPLRDPTPGSREDAFLSCDAVGCHGNYEFLESGGQAVGRHLLGGEGPSCYACHDRKWESDEPKVGRFEFDGKGED